MKAGRRPRNWTPAELKRMRSVVEAGEWNIAQIARQFRCSEHEVRRATNANGWINPNAVNRKPKAQRYRGGADYDAAQRESIADRERKLYGALLPDVQWLRRRGWGITKEAGGFRVGNRIMDAEEMRTVADRERRLAGVA